MQFVLHQLLFQQKKIAGPQASSTRDSNKLFQDFYGKSKPNFVIQSCHERQIKSIGSKHLLNRNLASFQKSMEMGKGISILNEEETEIKNYVHTFQKQQKNNVHFPRVKNIQDSRTTNTKSNATGVTDVSLQQTSSSSLILRKVCLKNKNKSPNKKFRKCVKCLIFLFRIKKLCKRTLKRGKQIKKLSQNLLKITEKMVAKYYLEILKVPLAHLQKIITNRTQKQPEQLMEEIATNLFSFSQILKNSSLRKDLLKFLSLITLERTPLPFDFFCQFQLRRLNFSQNSFRLVQVTEVQVKMMTGIFLALKVICIHLFGKIFNLRKLSSNQQGAIIINNLISYFYCVTTGLFQLLPCQTASFIEELKIKGVEPLKIRNQDLFVYERMTNDFKRQNKIIENNLSIWISRITKQVMASRSKLNQQY